MTIMSGIMNYQLELDGTMRNLETKLRLVVRIQILRAVSYQPVLVTRIP
jgi:hypothetical protein